MFSFTHCNSHCNSFLASFGIFSTSRSIQTSESFSVLSALIRTAGAHQFRQKNAEFGLWEEVITPVFYACASCTLLLSKLSGARESCSGCERNGAMLRTLARCRVSLVVFFWLQGTKHWCQSTKHWEASFALDRQLGQPEGRLSHTWGPHIKSHETMHFFIDHGITGKF